MENKAKKRKYSGRKWDKKVSRKFYGYLCRQIEIAASLCKEIREDAVRECVNFYIDSGLVICKINVAERVVFTLLQPQIDKAMLRSLRARMAALRRSMRLTVTDPTADPLSDTAVNVDLDAKSRQSDVVVMPVGGGIAASDDEAKVPAVGSSSALPRDEKRALRSQAALARRRRKHDKRLHRRQALKSSRSDKSGNCF